MVKGISPNIANDSASSAFVIGGDEPHPTRFSLVILLLLCISSFAVADVKITFPFQGWFRPGQYVPVLLRTDGTEGEFSLSSEGAIDTAIHLDSGRRTLIIPWLILQSPAPLTAAPGVNWTPLQPTQRLVGLIGSSPADLQSIFPNQQVIPLPLDESIVFGGDILDGDAVCWQTLDALVMDADRFDLLSSSRRQSLLDAGLSLVVVAPSDAAPGPEFQFHNGLWIARKPIFGPRGAVLGEAAYLPTYGWNADWPVFTRRHLVFSAAALFLLLLAISRLHWKSTWLLLSVIALVTTGILSMYALRQPPIFSIQARLLIRTPTQTQHDTWSYQTARQSTPAGLRWIGPTWPALFNTRQISHTHLTLRCGPDGLPRAFAYTLSPNSTLAFLTRQFAAPMPAQPPGDLQSPTLPLARQLYRSPVPIAQLPASDPSAWPTLILDAPENPAMENDDGVSDR